MKMCKSSPKRLCFLAPGRGQLGLIPAEWDCWMYSPNFRNATNAQKSWGSRCCSPEHIDSLIQFAVFPAGAAAASDSSQIKNHSKPQVHHQWNPANQLLRAGKVGRSWCKSSSEAGFQAWAQGSRRYISSQIWQRLATERAFATAPRRIFSCFSFFFGKLFTSTVQKW